MKYVDFPAMSAETSYAAQERCLNPDANYLEAAMLLLVRLVGRLRSTGSLQRSRSPSFTHLDSLLLPRELSTKLMEGSESGAELSVPQQKITHALSSSLDPAIPKDLSALLQITNRVV